MECCGLPEVALNGGIYRRAYGKWEAVYARFRKWHDEGVIKQIFRTLSVDADMENLSIDSTSVKVHQIKAPTVVKKG